MLGTGVIPAEKEGVSPDACKRSASNGSNSLQSPGSSALACTPLSLSQNELPERLVAASCVA
jgi:hypothetical protein